MFKALFNNNAVLVSSLGHFLQGCSILYIEWESQIILPSSVAANLFAIPDKIKPHRVNLVMAFQNAAGGILGLVGGMLVETILFIIRSSSKELASVPRSKKAQQTLEMLSSVSGESYKWPQLVEVYGALVWV